MSKPGRIPIKAAERISKAHDCPMVVIFAIQDDGQEFCVTTYGETKKLCRHAADLGRKISESILDGRIAPAESEPTDLPDVPTEFIGKLGPV
jgi:hypothetical protein